MAAPDYETKIYCCSNTTKAETKILASFDIFCSVLFLLYSTWFCELLKNRPEEFKNTTINDNSTLRDFHFLLDLEDQQQNFFVAGLLVGCGWNVALGGTLLFASEKEKQGLLKVWFGITLLEVLFGLFLVVLALWNFKRRVLISTTTIMVYLYKWYELWIVLGLIRDLHSGSTVFAKGIDDGPNPAFVIESPTPDHDPVYTIEGQGGTGSGPGGGGSSSTPKCSEALEKT
ncbi:unnamed protein product [Orchesella dallaii]|uniref:Uncharacterized protein n=1 Tax=Orchesella dallaii TaxID=48710 RepID=A0ABP1Q882_9HEXA